MPDDLDLNFDFSDPPVESPNPPVPDPVSPPAENTPPAIDPAQFQQMQQNYAALEAKYAAQEKKNQELRDFLAGNTGNSNQYDPSAEIGRFSQDPRNYIAQTSAEIAERIANQRINQAMAAQQLEAEYTAKYEDLLPFRKEIFNEAAIIQQQSNQAGKPLSDAEAIDQAVNLYQKKLHTTYTLKQKKQQQTSMQQNALNFTLPGAGQPQNPALSKAIEETQFDDAAWAAQREKFKPKF
jgi:hypothetical protein